MWARVKADQRRELRKSIGLFVLSLLAACGVALAQHHWLPLSKETESVIGLLLGCLFCFPASLRIAMYLP